MSWTFIQLSRQKEHVTPMEATSGTKGLTLELLQKF